MIVDNLYHTVCVSFAAYFYGSVCPGWECSKMERARELRVRLRYRGRVDVEEKVPLRSVRTYVVLVQDLVFGPQRHVVQLLLCDVVHRPHLAPPPLPAAATPPLPVAAHRTQLVVHLANRNEQLKGVRKVCVCVCCS